MEVLILVVVVLFFGLVFRRRRRRADAGDVLASLLRDESRRRYRGPNWKVGDKWL